MNTSNLTWDLVYILLPSFNGQLSPWDAVSIYNSKCF